MKKTYNAPKAELFDLHTEGTILADSDTRQLNKTNTTVTGGQALGNKNIWSSNNWTQK